MSTSTLKVKVWSCITYSLYMPALYPSHMHGNETVFVMGYHQYKINREYTEWKWFTLFETRGI